MPRHTAKHDALFEARLQDDTAPQESLGEPGLLTQLTKRLVERALEAALTEPRGQAPHARTGSGPGHGRYGKGKKPGQTATAQCDIDVPRDRDSRVDPQIGKKRQRRLDGFAEKVRALYARGLSTREIAAPVEEWQGGAVSPALLANVTDAVLDEVHTGPSRPLASGQPIVDFDGRAGAPDGPGNLARGHREGVDQDARAVADIFMLTALTPARLGWFGRGFALEDLHARFFIAADHQTTVLVGFQGGGVQVANGLRFGIKVFIMAVEPVCTLVRLEIGIVEDALDTGATEGRGAKSLEHSRHDFL